MDNWKQKSILYKGILHIYNNQNIKKIPEVKTLNKSPTNIVPAARLVVIAILVSFKRHVVG